jgi:hypothetical protein
MEKRMEQEPGVNTREPAEGKRADADEPSETVTGGHAERPGTKTTPPVEGADDSDGARRTTQSPRG